MRSFYYNIRLEVLHQKKLNYKKHKPDITMKRTVKVNVMCFFETWQHGTFVNEVINANIVKMMAIAMHK